jgi:phosphotransferase system enzyme I (PtsI)/phosphotransferase system enzyme I (PtsP)
VNVILELTRIVQAAGEAETPAEQVRYIVDAIQGAMAIDVCSLYLRNELDEMVLVASHGLAATAVGNAKLAAGVGLVGLVSETRHPVNLAEAASSPAFAHLEGTREEQYRSFCGVPLVRAGSVIGVLVVQSRQARKLSEEEEAFLVTLASQLALVVANWSDWQTFSTGSTRAITGIRGAPGIALGAAHLCEDVDLFTVGDNACADVETALEDWQRLVTAVQEDVQRERAALAGELSRDVTAIFDAVYLLLADPALVSGVEREIRAGHDLPSALKSVIQHYAELFQAMEDPYLRARHEDIRQLGNKLYNAWRNLHGGEAKVLASGPIVLVGGQVSVSDIAAVPLEHLAGIVCFQGSALSHTAVLANALGVPAVMGVGELKGVFDGELIVVDGNQGEVMLEPGAALLAEYERLADLEKQLRGRLQHLRDEPATTRDGVRINLHVNSGLLADLSPGLANGAEGLGLYRTEIPFMVSETFPSEEEQLHIYRQVLQAYRDKPVYMRVLDVGSDKPLPYFPLREDNPALGWRGIRFCLDNSSLLMTQLRAMLRAASGSSELRILLPMVSARTELVAFHGILDDALAQLAGEGVNVQRPPVGIMVEVPAAISQLPRWRDQIDFVSIGSNDLSQYLLAVDRNNPRVSSSYDQLHPAVLSEIARTVDLAAELKLPLSLCGEMSSDPAAVVLLVGMGIRTLSMSAARVPSVKWLLQNIDTASARRLLGDAMALGDTAAIRASVDSYLQTLDLQIP